MEGEAITSGVATAEEGAASSPPADTGATTTPPPETTSIVPETPGGAAGTADTQAAPPPQQQQQHADLSDEDLKQLHEKVGQSFARFRTENTRLTGEVAEPVLGREAKRDALLALRERLRLRPQDTLAVGDGANDIPMIEAAGLGIAFHGKPPLREAAGACIDHGDLTALLYAQGYRREEFIEAE